MNAHNIGIAIALAPIILTLIGLIWWGLSEHNGRMEAIVVFGGVGIIFGVPMVLGFYIAGRHETALAGLATWGGVCIPIVTAAIVTELIARRRNA